MKCPCLKARKNVLYSNQEHWIKKQKRPEKKDTRAATDNKRPGSEKRAKNAELTIHQDQVIQPAEAIPPGSRFKGYRDFVVQELVISTQNTRYRLARWETPLGQLLTGQLPDQLSGRHYGPHLISYITCSTVCPGQEKSLPCLN